MSIHLQIQQLNLELLKTVQMAEGQDKNISFLAISNLLERIQENVKELEKKGTISTSLETNRRYEDDNVIIH